MKGATRQGNLVQPCLDKRDRTAASKSLLNRRLLSFRGDRLAAGVGRDYDLPFLDGSLTDLLCL